MMFTNHLLARADRPTRGQQSFLADFDCLVLQSQQQAYLQAQPLDGPTDRGGWRCRRCSGRGLCWGIARTTTKCDGQFRMIPSLASWSPDQDWVPAQMVFLVLVQPAQTTKSKDSHEWDTSAFTLRKCARNIRVTSIVRVNLKTRDYGSQEKFIMV